MGTLRVGDFVEIHGLRGSKELNGCFGLAVAYIKETSRVGVSLTAGRKALLPENLRRVHESEPPSPRSRIEALSNLASQLSQQGATESQIQLEYVHAQLEKTRGRLDLCSRFSNEGEYPDPQRFLSVVTSAVVGFIVGITIASLRLCRATCFVWTFLLLHVLGVLCLSDYPGRCGLVTIAGFISIHAGASSGELMLWVCGVDGDNSLGAWSLAVVFAAVMYLHSFWAECVTLPPDMITSVSFFFPMFPAFNATVLLSCLEFFVEMAYFPACKMYRSTVVLGAVCMVVGQTLIGLACRDAHRNYWASCRGTEEPGEAPDLEIPDRKVVTKGIFDWERHPAYLGALLWAVGCQTLLFNPLMFCVVSIITWASLLYVTIEEEAELYHEFQEGEYAAYASLTPCRIPGFNSILSSSAFQREMAAKLDGSSNADCEDRGCTDGSGCELDADSSLGARVDPDAAPAHATCEGEEDELLLSCQGVKRGGVLWNRQFREPWVFG